jgi:hypothetical protein
MIASTHQYGRIQPILFGVGPRHEALFDFPEWSIEFVGRCCDLGDRIARQPNVRIQGLSPLVSWILASIGGLCDLSRHEAEHVPHCGNCLQRPASIRPRAGEKYLMRFATMLDDNDPMLASLLEAVIVDLVLGQKLFDALDVFV